MVTTWLVFGITSAYAEKSTYYSSRLQHHRNYLRIRGEELKTRDEKFSYTELPPHTRRRAQVTLVDFPVSGITSAYAEKRMWSYSQFT